MYRGHSSVSEYFGVPLHSGCITVKCIKGISFISLIFILIYMHVYNSKSNGDKVISLVRDIFVDYVEFNQDQI